MAKKMIDIKDEIGADALSKRGGIYTARWSFFYTHGIKIEDKVATVTAAFPGARIIEAEEVWKAFRGRASTANSSHWVVKFTID